MGIFQRYIKQDTDGAVLGKDGKPVKEGPWFIQYPHSRDSKTGKVKYRTEKASFSKKKAESLFRAKCDAFMEMEKFGVQIDHEMTFADLMTWGLDQEVMKIKASVVDDAARANHLKGYFGERKAIQITPLDVDNFRQKMKKTCSGRTKNPFSGTTINKMVSLARRIYYLGMDQGIVKSNPFARRGVFKEEPKGRYIPNEEFQTLQKQLPDFIRQIAVIAYLTGMRRGEILKLTWDRVDLFSGIVNLTSADTKTAEPRKIFFSSCKELKDIFIKAAKNKRPIENSVFITPEGKPVHPRYLERSFKKACETAEVGPYRFHDLRHTFNTNMLKAGVSQAIIMKLTGHKTNAMFNRYSHLDIGLGEAAMQKLNDIIGGQMV